MLDLSHIPLVDNHCHGLFVDGWDLDAAAYRHRFSECSGDPFPPDHTTTAPHYLWALRQIACALGCEAVEHAVIEARRARTQGELDRLFLGAANIDWLLVDDGYPAPDQVSDRDELAVRSGTRIGWLERAERWPRGWPASHGDSRSGTKRWPPISGRPGAVAYAG